MLWPILQILGNFTLDRLDQPTALRAAEFLIAPQGQIDIFRKTLNESMRLGKRRSALENDRLPVVRFPQPLQYPRNPVVFLHIDRWNLAMVRRGLNELQVRVR